MEAVAYLEKSEFTLFICQFPLKTWLELFSSVSKVASLRNVKKILSDIALEMALESVHFACVPSHEVTFLWVMAKKGYKCRVWTKKGIQQLTKLSEVLFSVKNPQRYSLFSICM